MDTNPCIGLLVEAMDTPIESAPSQLASARSTYPEVEPVAATMAPVPPGPAPDKPREKRRKMSALPSVSEIFEDIPGEGIELEELTSKFQKSIDETNVRLFDQLLNLHCTVDAEFRVRSRPVAELPSKSKIDLLIREARFTRTQSPKLEVNRKQEVTSNWLGTPIVTLYGPAERIREASNILRSKFYRISYETTVTLTAYVSKDTHAKHREIPELKFRNENAFQALGTRMIRDITKQRIQRHLRWNKKRDPSSFISTFNNISHAERRAQFHYTNSQRIGQRITCAEISTVGLVPATVRGKLLEITKLLQKTAIAGWHTVDTNSVERDVEVPIWIRTTGASNQNSTMTLEELLASDTEVWMSITELRQSNLRIPYTEGHDYEWLALGRIAKTSILRVMPFDGSVLNQKNPGRIVYSLESMEPWVFDWGAEMWVRDENKWKLAISQQEERITRRSRKRKAITNVSEDSEGIEGSQGSEGSEEDGHPAKRPSPTPTSEDQVSKEPEFSSVSAILAQHEQATHISNQSQNAGPVTGEECCSLLDKSPNLECFIGDTANPSSQKEEPNISLAEAKRKISELEGENMRLGCEIARLRDMLPEHGREISQPTNTKDSITS